MNKIVAVFILMAIASTMAAPNAPSAEAAAIRALPALEHEEVHKDSGEYSLRYVTAEGTVVSERGHLIPTADGKDHVLVTEGEVSYIGSDGQTYITKYSAGLDGFKAEGAHFPVAPEPVVVPEVIAPVPAAVVVAA